MCSSRFGWHDDAHCRYESKEGPPAGACIINKEDADFTFYMLVLRCSVADVGEEVATEEVNTPQAAETAKKRLDPQLALAAEDQMVDDAIALVFGGADPDSRDSWGKTPL